MTDPGSPTPALARSYLFVSGDRPERFDKALASGAEAVIIDLEDAVAPASRESARRAVAAWLQAAGHRRVVLRINAADTPWFDADLDLCREAAPSLAAVMLAKAERPEDLAAVARQAAGLPLVPLIESAVGFDRLGAIAAARGVQRLAFGAIDLQLDLGMQEAGFDDLIVFRSALVFASRLARIASPVDSPSTVIDDGLGDDVAAETLAARRLGFGAKLCIHPHQVAIANRGFRPSDAEVAWAEGVIAASAASCGAAVLLGGRMVDKPVVARAQALLRCRG